MSSIYYIRCGSDGLIKIGKALDPQRRLSQLQTGSGETLSLLATEPGGLDAERRRHKQFRALRVRGEWFRAEPALLRHIEDLQVGAGPARSSALRPLLAWCSAVWVAGLLFKLPRQTVTLLYGVVAVLWLTALAGQNRADYRAGQNGIAYRAGRYVGEFLRTWTLRC